jgi:hypothetical protein
MTNPNSEVLQTSPNKDDTKVPQQGPCVIATNECIDGSNWVVLTMCAHINTTNAATSKFQSVDGIVEDATIHV